MSKAQIGPFRLPCQTDEETRLDQPEDQAPEAIRYALSRWVGLIRFLDDGRIEIDSNVVDRAIHWAVIASLIETCKLCEVDPHAYLADVITRIVNGHLNSQIDDLLPWVYPTAPALKAVA